jgi:4-carboxymuconolactone decarboxylase
VRRAVLGDAYVEQSLAHRTPFQDFITRYAWSEVWDRRGLPRQTRSLITLAMLVALNRGDELRMHIRAALRNGVTIEEIQEVFLQCAIYCGVPAANAAFHLAEDVLSTDTPTNPTSRSSALNPSMFTPDKMLMSLPKIAA